MYEEYKIITKDDIEYPDKLKNYGGMPSLLYVKGNLPDPDRKSVAIVGSRGCSAYGRKSALYFAEALAEAGVQIISGLALGIDSYAHIGCLDGHGKTFAVMGCGINEVYPRSNRDLYNKIIDTGGGIISEFEPGAPPVQFHFPLRNRIISALSDAVIIVEAKVRSGSLITASYALEQGISVYAVPGKVSDSLSEGTNYLIWQGATPALSPIQILKDLDLIPVLNKKSRNKPAETKTPYSSDENSLLKLLSSDPLSIDEICSASSLDASITARLLFSLEMKGAVYSPYPGSYIRADC